MTAAAWANVVLSLAALAGLVGLAAQVRAQGAEDPLNRRFLFGLRVTQVLFAGRALFSLTGWAGVQALVLLAASLIPLAVLILTEGLLRRHAPGPVKLFVATGTLLLALAALMPGPWVEPVRIWALLVFQIATLLVAGAMIVSRDKTSLTLAENRMAERLGLSLILLIPLIGADYLSDVMGLPVLLSPLAVLVLCWLALSLSAGDGAAGHRASLARFGTMAGLSLGAAATAAALVGLDRDGWVITLALVLAAAVLTAVLNDARGLRAQTQSLSLLSYLAEAGKDRSSALIDSPVTFLRGLADQPLVQGAVLLGPSDLSDLDDGILQGLFANYPVLRLADVPGPGPARDHAQHLFDRFAATHFLLAGRDPLQLVALAMPALAASPRAELELRVVQRMAMLLAERGA